MFAGLADSTMSRDDGWRFLVLGRSIERADMVLRLLLSRVRDKASSPGWMTALRLDRRAGRVPADQPGSAQRQPGRPVPAPRPVVPALGVLRAAPGRNCLEEIAGRTESWENDKPEALRLLGRARSELEFLRPDDLLHELPRRLGALQSTIKDAGEAVSVQYFHAEPWVAWEHAAVPA